MKNTSGALVLNSALEKFKERLSLRQLVKNFYPLPPHGVVFGMGEDERPVLFDVKSSTSPNIIIWDKLSRQGLRILKVIAEYVFRYHREASYKPQTIRLIEFVVLTRYAEEWGDLNQYGMGMSGNTSCIGIIPFGSELANVVMRGLALWSHETHSGSKDPVIVLIDGMENLDRMSEDFKLDLRYVLFHGRRKNVYVIGTAEFKNFAKVQSWLDGFQAAVYGSDVIDVFELVKDKKELWFYAPSTELI